jgi:hypothetical protein
MGNHTPTPAVIHIARISLRNESPVEFAAATGQALERAIAAWCREHWAAGQRRNADLASQPPSEDNDVIEEYFAAVDTDFLECSTASIERLDSSQQADHCT